MHVQPNGLFWASLALLGCACISLVWELRITQTLVVAGIRAFLQLSLLGMVLNQLFQVQNTWITLITAFIMTAIGTLTISQRTKEEKSSKRWAILFQVFAALSVATGFSMVFAGNFILAEDSWKRPQVFIPFFGLLLGNSISGISLGLSEWNESLRTQRSHIETSLAYGASRWEAMQGVISRSFTTAMTPILNSMTVAGIISLPGMMTGQLLAGADAKIAIQYQIVILFLIAFCTFAGVGIALILGYRTILNDHHQLDLRILSYECTS